MYSKVNYEDIIPTSSNDDMHKVVPFSLAKYLKDCGYNGEVNAFYDSSGRRWSTIFPADFNNAKVDCYEQPECSSPTYNEVVDFFRENLGIVIVVDAFFEDGEVLYTANVIESNEVKTFSGNLVSDDYYNALCNGIWTAIDIIYKVKNNSITI